MVWYGMVWYGIIWYDMIWHGMVWCGMVWYDMIWYGVACGMVWYGMIWHGVVWYDMVWYDVVKWEDAYWTVNWKGCVTKWSWPNFSFRAGNWWYREKANGAPTRDLLHMEQQCPPLTTHNLSATRAATLLQLEMSRGIILPLVFALWTRLSGILRTGVSKVLWQQFATLTTLGLLHYTGTPMSVAVPSKV